MRLKKISFIVFIFFMIIDYMTFAAFSPENNIIADEVEHNISPGLKYKKTIEVCDGIRQEIYSFEFTPSNKTVIVPVYGQYIYGFNSVGDLISSYDGDGRVVGGINTDFFITNTGVPLSCLVSNREIISSCDDRVAIGFDENGDAVIGNPSIKAELVHQDNDQIIPVAHINKTPGIWGLYLVNDKFSTTTHSSVDSTEIVLKPVIDSENDEVETSEDVTSDSAHEYNSPLYFSDDVDDQLFADNEDEVTSTTDEPIIEDTYPENDTNTITNTDYITNYDGVLRLGESVKTVVTEIRENSMNSPIPEGCFVACIPNENYSYLADDIQVGDEIIIDLSYNDDVFSDSINIFGAGTEIVKDGAFVEQAEDSIFKYRNPRTAVGIKEDGTVIFVCVDGRRSGVSVGYTIKELADYLISKGCISAVNFDGGGSTTLYAADLGELYSSLKNTPSDGRERRIADGLIFVNMAEPNGIPTMASVYPSNYYVYSKDASVAISDDVFFADSMYYPVLSNNDTYSIEIDDELGVIQDGLFTPSGVSGIAPINVNYKGSVFEAGQIIITEVVDKFEINADNLSLDPFEESTDISFSASLNTIPIAISEFSPEVSIYTYTTDDNEELIEASPSDAYFDANESVFVPNVRGVKYRIEAYLGGVTDYVDIDVEKYPFEDMSEHWGKLTAYDMYKNGMFVGETTFDGERLFFPERNITKAEFCTVLARALEIDTEPICSFDDSDVTLNNEFENVPDWARPSVLALHKENYIQPLLTNDEDGQIVFNYDEHITRMDVIRVFGNILLNMISVTSENIDQVLFTDFIAEHENDIDYLNAVYDKGIIKGFEDGTVRQHENLTRAQAATVFSRFIDTFN